MNKLKDYGIRILSNIKTARKQAMDSKENAELAKNLCSRHPDIKLDIKALDFCNTCNTNLCYICSNTHGTKASCTIECLIIRGFWKSFN